MSVPVADATTLPSTTTLRQVSVMCEPPPTQAFTYRRCTVKDRVSMPWWESGAPSAARKLYDVANRLPDTFSSVRMPNGRRKASGVSATVTGPAPKAVPDTVQPEYVVRSQSSNRMSARSVNTIASTLMCAPAPARRSTIWILARRPWCAPTSRIRATSGSLPSPVAVATTAPSTRMFTQVAPG